MFILCWITYLKIRSSTGSSKLHSISFWSIFTLSFNNLREMIWLLNVIPLSIILSSDGVISTLLNLYFNLQPSQPWWVSYSFKSFSKSLTVLGTIRNLTAIGYKISMHSSIVCTGFIISLNVVELSIVWCQQQQSGFPFLDGITCSIGTWRCSPIRFLIS